MRSLASFLIATFLWSCGPQPDAARPALWEVSGPQGGTAWLFGTIHALEKPAAWRGAEINNALERTDLLLVEIIALDDPQQQKSIFDGLARSPGQGLLSPRIDPALRPALLRLLNSHGLKDTQFAQTETWAAALTLAQAETQHLNSKFGIDRAVLEAAKGKPVEELEGVLAQLSVFDNLPATEQSDLLAAVVTDADKTGADAAALAAAWRTGQMDVIALETERGMMSDPELRAALLINRNHSWAVRINAAIQSGKQPFVAVGAAHMAGPEGLPALLAARGYTVRRIQ